MNNGLKVGSKGGHGPIGYTIQELTPAESIKFQFTKPGGFNGFHEFEIAETESGKTEVKHTIEMDTSFKAYIQWMIAMRWLHDAFIEDAFDKVENHFTKTEKATQWNTWVKFLRRILRPKTKRNLSGKISPKIQICLNPYKWSYKNVASKIVKLACCFFSF